SQWTLPALLRLLAQPRSRTPHAELHRDSHRRLVSTWAPHARLDPAHVGRLPAAFRSVPCSEHATGPSDGRGDGCRRPLHWHLADTRGFISRQPPDDDRRL